MVCPAAGRTQLFVASADGAEWGFYDAAGLPKLVAWLEGGSDAEQETAERVYEAFAPTLRAAAVIFTCYTPCCELSQQAAPSHSCALGSAVAAHCVSRHSCWRARASVIQLAFQKGFVGARRG